MKASDILFVQITQFCCRAEPLKHKTIVPDLDEALRLSLKPTKKYIPHTLNTAMLPFQNTFHVILAVF